MSAIVTERFILRPQTITDYDVWYPMYSDPKIFHLVNAPGFTPEEAWNRLLRNIGHWSIFGYGIFSIFQKSDGTFLGETGLANFHRGIDENFENCVEASWVISRSAQGLAWQRKPPSLRISGLSIRFHLRRQFVLSQRITFRPFVLLSMWATVFMMNAYTKALSV